MQAAMDAEPLMFMRYIDTTSHTFSLTWTSPEEKERERYSSVRTQLRLVSPRSKFVPWTWPEWLTHRIAVVDVKKQQAENMIEQMIQARRDGVVTIGPSRLTAFTDARGGVLSMPTIWCVEHEQEGRSTAPWPSLQELKWEGDDRAKTTFHRFPPLPREPGNETVAWHHLRILQMYEFDQVRSVPKAEDFAWANAIKDDKPEHLLLSSLWDAIDTPP